MATDSERHEHKPVSPVKPAADEGKSAEELIREEQDIVREYLPPDSGVTEHEAFNELLDIIDGPDAQRFADPEPKPRKKPTAH